MNTTAFLIRSIALQWEKGTVLALDAGVHIGAILKVFEQTLARVTPKANQKRQGRPTVNTPLFTIGTRITDGPFKDLEVRAKKPCANAAYVMRELIDVYLITHPHLDHISGLITNSPAISPDNPKIIAGLPSTIEAIKNHIFNGIIWPNLSSENNGLGFVKYLRLRDGGRYRQSLISDAGYTHICQGLSIFSRSVSHGRAKTVEGGHTHHGLSSIFGAFLSPLLNWIPSHSAGANPAGKSCAVESTAYFVKDSETGTEILVFGDIEPDSVSLSPKNKIVWQDAAPKIKSGNLKAIFMECSWDNSQEASDLYGHMNPHFVMEELQVLANLVSSLSRDQDQEMYYSRMKGKQPLSDVSNEFSPSRKTRKYSKPLEGLSVVIIHMKERLDDGYTIQELVEMELLEIERSMQLGCNFVISEPGMSLEF